MKYDILLFEDITINRTKINITIYRCVHFFKGVCKLYQNRLSLIHI